VYFFKLFPSDLPNLVDFMKTDLLLVTGWCYAFSTMPPSLFTTLPSLPMFLVESGENRLTSQSEKPESLNVQSTSEVTSCGIDSEAQQRLHRKVQQISVLMTFCVLYLSLNCFLNPSSRFIKLCLCSGMALYVSNRHVQNNKVFFIKY
jgi:hypothetical protein